MIRLVLICLLVALPARATELKVTTWNLEWLTARLVGDPALPPDVKPKSAEDIDVLRGYAKLLDADVVAIQEVDGPEIAARIFTPDRYDIFMTNDSVVQRVGFAIRHGIVVHRNPDLVSLDVYPDAKFHLRSGADITLEWPGVILRLLAVHLKTGCHGDKLTSPHRPCETLRLQIPAVQGWIAQRRDDGVPFLVLGDFNRRMDGQEAVFAALSSTAPLARATAGHASPCWGGGAFIDHVLAGGAARAWMEPDSLRVLVYRETSAEAKERLSDHCPVSVRFRLPD